MFGKTAAGLFAAFCIAAIPSTSSGQPMSNKPLTVLAGSYLHGAEQIRLIKNTKCAYALRSPFPTYKELLESDVLPAFPEAERERFRRAAQDYLGAHEAENRRRIDTQLENLKTELDEKTACGFLAGMYLGVFESYKDRWQEMKKTTADPPK